MFTEPLSYAAREEFVKILLSISKDDFLSIMKMMISDDVERFVDIPQFITNRLAGNLNRERVKVYDFAWHTHAAMAGMLKNDGVRARALRDILLSGQFHGAPVEKELQEEFDRLSSSASVKEYLESFPYGGA